MQDQLVKMYVETYNKLSGQQAQSLEDIPDNFKEFFGVVDQKEITRYWVCSMLKTKNTHQVMSITNFTFDKVRGLVRKIGMRLDTKYKILPNKWFK